MNPNNGQFQFSGTGIVALLALVVLGGGAVVINHNPTNKSPQNGGVNITNTNTNTNNNTNNSDSQSHIKNSSNPTQQQPIDSSGNYPEK